MIGQSFGVFLEEMPDCPDSIQCSFVLEPKQENASMEAPFSKHLLPDSPKSLPFATNIQFFNRLCSTRWRMRKV